MGGSVVLGSDRDQFFAAFWQAYPRKTGKGQARKAWATARRRGVPPENLIRGAQRYAEDPNRDPAYTKHPATWLNGECWDDEPLPDRRPQATYGAAGTAAAARQLLAKHASTVPNEPPSPAIDPGWLSIPVGGGS